MELLTSCGLFVSGYEPCPTGAEAVAGGHAFFALRHKTSSVSAAALTRWQSHRGGIRVCVEGWRRHLLRVSVRRALTGL